VRVLALGEALVDLVRERPDSYAPHRGGAVANTALVAASLGADVALAGGAGDDDWGRWLRDGLEAAGVDLTWFELVAGLQTPVAFVRVDEGGEPEFSVYGQDIARTIVPLADRIDEAVEACGGLFLSSNTLVDEEGAHAAEGGRSRAVTMRARERALELGRPVVFDPNLRLHRWPSATRAAAAAREVCADALLVRCNLAEAELLTGEPDPVAAAEGLLAGGAQHVVVTLGPDGALLRGGGLRLDVPGVPARVVDATGAGDTLMGVLLARLALSGFYPPALAAALPEAVERAARATEHFGAHPG
jgi:fructokinase